MSGPQAKDLRASAVRAKIPGKAQRRSTVKGLLLFAVGLGLYLATFLATVLAPWWPLKLFFSLANAFFLATLFVIGHDACHEAFVPYRWLNALLGRIALLPPGTRTPVGRTPIIASIMSGPTCGRRTLFQRRCRKTSMIGCRRGGGPCIAGIARRRAWEPTIFSRFISRKSFFRRKIIAAARPCGDFWPMTCFWRLLSPGRRRLWSMPGTVRHGVSGGRIAVLRPVAAFPDLDVADRFSDPVAPHPPADTLVRRSAGMVVFQRADSGNFARDFSDPVNWFIHHIMEHTAHHVDSHVPLYHLVEAQKKPAAGVPRCGRRTPLLPAELRLFAEGLPALRLSPPLLAELGRRADQFVYDRRTAGGSNLVGVLARRILHRLESSEESCLEKHSGTRNPCAQSPSELPRGFHGQENVKTRQIIRPNADAQAFQEQALQRQAVE